MNGSRGSGSPETGSRGDWYLPDTVAPLLSCRFEAVVFDWDGTAVADRGADAAALRVVVERLCALGMYLTVITGTHVGNIDGQLKARPRGSGRLVYCVNRGSEVFEARRDGVALVERRVAATEEVRALDAAAAATVAALAARGVAARLVSNRLNRRKIDLIPVPRWANPPKAEIGELLAAVESELRGAGLAGLAQAVSIAEGCARSAGLPNARVTSDAKHIEIGLTDKSDSARWAFAELWRCGISPGGTLIVGDEFGPLGGLPGSDMLLLVPQALGSTVVSVGREPNGTPEHVLARGGGADTFLAVLEAQLGLRERRDPPAVGDDAGWTVTVDGIDPELEAAHEALLTVSAGVLGTNGAPVWRHPAASPRVYAAGAYQGEGPATELAPAPVWHLLARDLPADARLHRKLDLHTGLQSQSLTTAGEEATATLFSSLKRPGVVALRARGPRSLVGSGAPLHAPDGEVPEAGQDGTAFASVAAGPGGVHAKARDVETAGGVERIGSYQSDPLRPPTAAAAAAPMSAVQELGFEGLLDEHRHTWAGRWEAADIVIEGDAELQTAVRFALFHLMASVAPSGEAAVGARGLSGPGYRGHVFWDADVFVLPFLAATHPPAARAILEYRVRRLAAARVNAAARGLRGARFPWESARDGDDATPRSVVDQNGVVVPVHTGEREEHIVADVAWAAGCYIDWTGDEAFAAGPGCELLVETARYWASRVRTDADGAAHIDGVIGPDEYHEAVDDNAFTNGMAIWNLRRAAAAAQERGLAEPIERASWLATAAALTDGFRADLGVHEEFAGFLGLEPLVIADIVARRPIAADVLLGRDRVSGAQVVKQADVLMLHHLIPDDMPPGSLAADLAFYEPRTAHGSSLSLAVHASLLARAGHVDRALQALQLAAKIDLVDSTGTTAGGLHLGAMGGVWQALVFGFAGIRPRGDVLVVSPRLPDAWERMEVRIRFRGTPIRVLISHKSVEIEGDGAFERTVETS